VALWGGASLAFLLLALLLHLVFDIPPVAAILTPFFLGYALSSGFALLLSLYMLMTLPPSLPPWPPSSAPSPSLAPFTKATRTRKGGRAGCKRLGVASPLCGWVGIL